MFVTHATPTTPRPHLRPPAAGRRRNPRGQGDRLREDLIEAALGLMAETGDPEDISIRAVAKSAGVSPTAAYRHFEDRDSLIAAACEANFVQFAAYLAECVSTEQDPFERLRLAGRGYLAFATADPGRYRVLFSNPITQSIKTRAVARGRGRRHRVRPTRRPGAGVPRRRRAHPHRRRHVPVVPGVDVDPRHRRPPHHPPDDGVPRRRGDVRRRHRSARIGSPAGVEVSQAAMGRADERDTAAHTASTPTDRSSRRTSAMVDAEPSRQQAPRLLVVPDQRFGRGVEPIPDGATRALQSATIDSTLWTLSAATTTSGRRRRRPAR